MPANRARIPKPAWALVALSLAIALIASFQDGGQYPSLRIHTGSGVDLLYINHLRSSPAECELTLSKIEQQLKKNCPQCTTQGRQCSSQLAPSQAAYFTADPQAYPVAHLPQGVMVFESKSPELAQVTCTATAAALQQQSTSSVCFAAETRRPFFRASHSPVDLKHIGFALLALLFAQLVSKFACWLIIRYEHLHAHFSHDHTQAGPQKFHATPTPRIGGLPLMVGLMVSGALLLGLPNQFADGEYGLLLLAALPAFLGGLTEDVTKRVGVRDRLLLTMLSGLLASLLLDATITRLEIPGLDTLLQWAPLAVAFTVFAVGGVANSINLIDGYNGLAAGFGILASSAFAYVAAMQGDSLLLFANFGMIGALIGFMVWNWPGGKIFLGDGGAYLLGFWLAEIGILLVVRNPDVSVWCPLTIMAYPVFETLYSIYRRQIKNRSSFGEPDAAHLHHLIYQRSNTAPPLSLTPKAKVRLNSRVSPKLWGFAGIFAGIGSYFYQSHTALQLTCLAFCVSYVMLYSHLARKQRSVAVTPKV